jgi:Putative Tad-like Flp pilus-assembly
MSPSGTTARSLSLGRAGITLALVAGGTLTLYQFVATSVDVQLIAAAQADAQATANAAAAGAIAELPHGAVAVIRTAGQVIASRKAISDAAKLGEADIQIGYWDAVGRSFSTGPRKPNAVRTTIRLRSQIGLLGMVFGGRGQQIEVQAIAVHKSIGAPLIATKGTSSAN